MADYLTFDSGKSYLENSGLPASCYFGLSTKSVDGTNPWTAADTMATAGKEVSGTGYTRQSETRPTPVNGVVGFAAKVFATAGTVDWPNAVRSVFLTDGATAGGTTGTLIAAWNLQAAGVARDLSAANTSESITCVLTLS